MANTPEAPQTPEVPQTPVPLTEEKATELFQAAFPKVNPPVELTERLVANMQAKAAKAVEEGKLFDPRLN